MKKSIVILILIFQSVFAQNENKKDEITFKPEFNINLIVPNHTGENYLAEATNATFGIGVSSSFLEYQNFNLGLGLDHINYRVTDISKGGDLGSRNLRSLYIRLGYRFNLDQKLEINPYLGIGDTKLSAKESRYGYQCGTDYRIGAHINYKLNKTFAPFIGISYLRSNFNVNTVPEYRNFFNHSNMIQIVVGVNIR